LAYVFLDDRRTMNAELVRQGLALADRQTPGALLGSIQEAQTEARKKHRGCWESTRESQKILAAG
jgi:endonuclease YncB( thermonuclease family)